MPNINSETDGENVTDAILPAQSYVGTWNIPPTEFPLTVQAMSTSGIIPPLEVTMGINGMQSMGPPVNPTNTQRMWARVEVSNLSTPVGPMVVDTLMLSSTEPEPPVAASSQYIRVVIRNIILPQGERDNI